MGLIVHIAEKKNWEKAKKQGIYAVESLKSDGFIHCSTIGQVMDTANLFFPGRQDLILLCIDESKTSSQVKYEPPTGEVPNNPSVEAMFPHLYGPLNLDAVVNVFDFPPDPDGTFQLPGEVAKIEAGL
ncbi:MAG TPA: DUF952 domain-containing protein [bacterium]|nr:DUF952 domain-containing protein [bacterium]